MTPPPFADISPEPVASPTKAAKSTGFPSIDRVLAEPDPIADRYARGEATLKELLERPGADADSGVTIEETIAWLRGRGAGCDGTG
ncbi:MAG: hypothetical protein U0359_03835 [Byssovorax sp.]